MNPTKNDQPATRADVEEIVGRVVNGAVKGATAEILDAVGDQFDIVNDRIDQMEDKLTDKLDVLERKTTNVLDDHSLRISKLEKQEV